MKTINLSILSPERSIFSGDVSGVRVQGTEGSFEVLPGHAAIISTLAAGKLRYKSGSEEITMNAGAGVIEVLNNKVIVLIEESSKAEESGKQ